MAGERNYHIFYQLLCGASDDERKALKLLSSASDYSYTKGGIPTIDGVDDSREWQHTRDKLEMLEVSGEGQKQMLVLISAVLALGNVTFKLDGKAAQQTGDTPPLRAESGSLERAVSLLSLPVGQLEKILTTRVVSTGKGASVYTVSHSESQCDFIGSNW